MLQLRRRRRSVYCIVTQIHFYIKRAKYTHTFNGPLNVQNSLQKMSMGNHCSPFGNGSVWYECL